ncbi:uncharacterized protein [Amphiura filiformis]|uniref:uncharacterized protein n=1 Tax=Amphiura filiformis TaxID=82378 RepID=UPI003B223460
MAFTENIPPMLECYNFTLPLHDESLVLVYTLVNNTSGGQIDLRCRLEPVLCNHVYLDREEGDHYVIVIEANNCNPRITDCSSCEGQATGRMSPNVEQTAEVQPVAVASNQMVLDITVIDINDNKPTTTGFITGLPKKYWIGIADNVPYNTTLFKIDATDRDLNHSLVYELSVYQPPLQNIVCTGLPILKLNNQGTLLSRDAVYRYLDVDKTDIWLEQVFCEYVVTVTDVNTDPNYMDMRSVSIPTKIKVLYSFEHAIIIIDSPPEMIVGQAEELAKCFSQGMTHYILRVEFVRAKYIEEKNGFTTVDPDRTDLWVYAIHDKTGVFAKYWEIKSAWDANPVKDQCLPIISPLADGESPGIRPAHIRKDYLYPYASYVGWAVLAMACLVFLAALICLFILYESWDRMVVERTKYLAAVKREREYRRSKYVDAGIVTDAWDLDQPMPVDYQIEKQQLYETQEMIMELLPEYYDGYIPSDEAVLSIIRAKTSGSEVQTIVDRGEFEEDDNEMVSTTRDFNAAFGVTEDRNEVFGATEDRNGVFSITKEVTTTYGVGDVPTDEDDKPILAIGKGKGSLKTTDKGKQVVIKTKTPGSEIKPGEKVSMELERGGAMRRVVKTEATASKTMTLQEISVEKEIGGDMTHVVKTEARAHNIRAVSVEGGDMTHVVKTEATARDIKTVSVEGGDMTHPESPVKGLISRYSSGSPPDTTATDTAVAFSFTPSDAPQKQLQPIELQLVVPDEKSKASETTVVMSQQSTVYRIEAEIDGPSQGRASVETQEEEDEM